MRFEFDQRKNEVNQEKHHISFEEAAEIWNDPDLLVLHAKKRGEKRLLAIGKAYTVLYSVIHTKHEETIRIISARRATERERRAYEQHRDY
ncbi:BrnT family toxin [Atopobiaceae bacterium HCP3S3_A4]